MPELTPDEKRLIAGLHGTEIWRTVKKWLYLRACEKTTALNRGDFSDKPWTAGGLVSSRDLCEELSALPETILSERRQEAQGE